MSKKKPAQTPAAATTSTSQATATRATAEPASSCPHCGSTSPAERIGNEHQQEHRGYNTGLEYSVIIRQRVRCRDCGQHRIDRSYE